MQPLKVLLAYATNHCSLRSLYNHIELASNLGIGCDYNIFKNGIQPMWEDERNKRGGRWLFVLSKGKGNPNQSKAVDELWLEVVSSSK